MTDPTNANDDPHYDRNGNNGWSQPNPFKLIEEALPHAAQNMIRLIYGVIGFVAIVFGMALLVWPGKTMAVLACILGAYFVVSGIMRIIGAIVEGGLPGGWRVLQIIVGLLLAIGGVIVLKYTALSGGTLALAITLMVGLGWMMEGVMALVESAQMAHSGWAMSYAVISIIAGLVVLFFPLTSALWLMIFAGCALLVMGISAVIRAFTFGRH